MKLPPVVIAVAIVLAPAAFAQRTDKLTPVQAQRAAAAAQAHQKPAPAQHAAPTVRSRASTTPVVQPTPPPAPLVGGADSCVTPDVVTGTGSFNFDNTLATTGVEGQNESLCNLTGAGTTIINDIWFRWTATQTGLAEVNTCNLGFIDTKIAIYNGTTCPVNGSAIACNDDACPGYQSTVSFPCVLGSSYVIQIGNYPGQFPPATPGTGVFSITVHLSPTNDDCSTPIAVTGSGPFAFDNTYASTGAQGQSESLCSIFGSTTVNNDVWYTWTAPFSGAAAVDTCSTAVDTKIAVYPGAGCPAASALGCNDDYCGVQSRTLFACTAGQTYTIQLGLYPFTTFGGAGTFNITNAMPPANDDCTAPVSITGLGNTTYDATNATAGLQGQSENLCFFNGTTAINSDLWFAWTASFSGTAGVRTCGQQDDTKIAVYAGSGCPASSAIACDDDFCNLQSLVTFPCTAGNVYMLQVGVASGAFGGVDQFNVFDAAPPANDACTSAITVSGAGPFPFDNGFATTGSQGQSEALCATTGNPAVPGDIWYTWTAPSTGAFSFQTVGLTTIDTKIAVYPGSGCPTSVALACNDDANEPNQVYAQSQAIFNASAGSTYTLQIGLGAFAGLGGDGEFSVVPVNPPSNDDCTTPIAVSGFGPHFFDNTQATAGAQGQSESLCNFFGSTAFPSDVWFTWTPAGSGTATLTFCGLTITDTKVSVYNGTGCPTSSSIACNEDACGFIGYQSEVTFPALCGQTYTIQIGTFPNYTAPAGGQGRFTVDVPGSSGCSVGTVFCAGDGMSPHLGCPCGNNSPLAAQVGCINSFSVGAGLRAAGSESIAGDTVTLTADGLPMSSTLFFQGTNQTGNGTGSVFGDGLRCAGGTVIRLRTYMAAGSPGSAVSTYPHAGDPSVSVRGAVTVPGSRTYQVWYRNAAAFCTPSTFNLTNGLQIDWQP